MTDIAVAIVNYNTATHLRRCLEHIRAAGVSEVVVKDNGSTDGSPELVRREFPEVRLLDDPSNNGYGDASNRAIAACRAPYVLLLNSDAYVAPDSPRVLADYLDRHPRAAVVGPLLRNVDGSLQPSAKRFPQPWTLRPVLRLIPPLRGRTLLDWPHDRARPVPWVKGAALAIRRTAFDELGGFDPWFFMYFEETDLCRRAWDAGWEVHFTPATAVVHVGGASTDTVRAAMAVQFFDGMRQFYLRHHPRWRQEELALVLRADMTWRWVRDGVRRRLTRDPARARRLAEDAQVWRRVMRRLHHVPPTRDTAGS